MKEIILVHTHSSRNCQIVEFREINLNVLKDFSNKIRNIDISILTRLKNIEKGSFFIEVAFETDVERKTSEFIEIETYFMNNHKEFEKELYTDISKLKYTDRAILREIYLNIIGVENLEDKLYEMLDCESTSSINTVSEGNYNENMKILSEGSILSKVVSSMTFYLYGDIPIENKQSLKCLNVIFSENTISKNSKVIWMHNLNTDEEFKKQGYASRLIDYINEKYSGYAIVMQVGSSDSYNLSEFYEKRGFTIKGVRIDDKNYTLAYRIACLL